jgi:four helix bundle protein
VRVKSLDELEVYQRALDSAGAVSAIINRPGFRSDPELRNQVRDTSSRIPSHVAEGFGQKTDRHFAHFLYIARGSCNEMRAHLAVALGRKYISASECGDLSGRYVVIGKQLTRLLQHLHHENRTHRG